MLWRCWLGGRKGIRPVKNWAVGCWHGYLPWARCRLAYGQRMPLPLTVSCFSKIQFGFTFLVPAHPGSHGQRAIKRVCVCLCVSVTLCIRWHTWHQSLRLHHDSMSVWLTVLPRRVVRHSLLLIRQQGTHYWNVYVSLPTALLFLNVFSKHSSSQSTNVRSATNFVT